MDRAHRQAHIESHKAELKRNFMAFIKYSTIQLKTEHAQDPPAWAKAKLDTTEKNQDATETDENQNTPRASETEDKDKEV